MSPTGYGARMEFGDPPYPAMVSSPELNAAVATYLGADAVMALHAAYPFNGEDFAADERAIGVGVHTMAGFLSSRLRA